MTIQTFNPAIAPSPGTSATQKLKLLKAEFGDGYVQTVQNGLNYERRSLRLTWDLLHPSDAIYITDFLTLHGGNYPFWYTPSDEANAIKWTCVDWSDDRIDSGYRRISATFEESFDTRTTLDLPLYQPRGTVPGSAEGSSAALAISNRINQSTGNAPGASNAVFSWVDQGSLVYIDFTTQFYSLNTVQTPLATLVDRTNMPISSSGARFNWNVNNDYCSNLTATARQVLPTTGGFTLVAEWQITDDLYSYMYPLGLFQNNTGYQVVSIKEYNPTDTGTYLLSNYQETTIWHSIPQPPASSIRRMAFTRKANSFASSVNGSAVLTNSTVLPFEPVYDIIRIGGHYVNNWSYMNGYFRKMAIYPPMTDTQLQALSAL